MRPRLVQLSLAALAALVLVAAPGASAEPRWIGGQSQSSTVWNCVGIIFGNWYQEPGMKAEAYVFMDPDAPPQVGQTFYVASVDTILGNVCPEGIQVADVEIVPPDGVELAISGSTPVRCTITRLSDNHVITYREPECYQGIDPQVYGYHFGTWGFGQGWSLELQIPVRATRAVTNAQLRFAVKVTDGNSNPWLFPQVPLYSVAPPPPPPPPDDGGDDGGGDGGGGGTTPPPSGSTTTGGAAPGGTVTPSGSQTTTPGQTTTTADSGTAPSILTAPAKLSLRRALKGFAAKVAVAQLGSRVRLVWTAKIRGRTRTLARRSADGVAAGTYTARLRPGRTAARLLRRSGVRRLRTQLRVRVTVAGRPAATQTTTITIAR